MAAAIAFDVTIRWRGDVVCVERRTAPAASPLTLAAIGLADLGLDPLDGDRKLSRPAMGAPPTSARFGDISVEIARGAIERPTRAPIDLALWIADVASALGHAGALAALALLAMIHGTDDGTGDERTATLRDKTLAVELARGTTRDDAEPESEGVNANANVNVNASVSATGHAVAPKASPSRVAVPAAGESRAASTMGMDAITEARSFGMIALLASPLSAVGSAGEWGPAGDSRSASAGTATELGSIGGLALSGVGEGGGGRGEAIGLGSIGTVAHCSGRCVGSGVGVGVGRGRLDARGHQVGVPTLRCGNVAPGELSGGCVTQVNGRLPPEVVQRVVRQNFGRLRACYEAGLMDNPSLEGRVVIKFVIDRDGRVSASQDGGSDLANASVVGCVVRAMSTLSFPEPEGGTVTVVYPLALASS